MGTLEEAVGSLVGVLRRLWEPIGGGLRKRSEADEGEREASFVAQQTDTNTLHSERTTF
jgi:hypothetical protein